MPSKTSPSPVFFPKQIAGRDSDILKVDTGIRKMMRDKDVVISDDRNAGGLRRDEKHTDAF